MMTNSQKIKLLCFLQIFFLLFQSNTAIFRDSELQTRLNSSKVSFVPNSANFQNIPYDYVSDIPWGIKIQYPGFSLFSIILCWVGTISLVFIKKKTHP